MTLIYKKEKNELLEFKNIIEDDARRDNYFREHHDSFNMISWNDYIKIVEGYGFVRGYYAEFEGDNKIIEKEAVYYLKEKGLLLYAYTRGGICVDNAILWGQFYAPHDVDLTNHHGLSGLCHIYNEYGKAVEFFLDVKEGFVYKVDTLIMNFMFYDKWKSMGVLNFANYIEREYSEQSISIISYNKVERSCKDIIDIVFSQYLII